MTLEVQAPARMACPTLYLLGDAHLGAQSPEKEAQKHSRFVSFLAALRGQTDSQLVICGDLFDFWFEYRHAVARSHFRALVQLANLIDSGVPVDYLAGNHDFWLGSFLQDEVEITVHPERLELLQGGKHILLMHGDGVMPKDHLYRLMKKVLRHPLSITGYRLLHPDWGIPFAHLFSHWSREAKRADYSNDEDYRAFACGKIDEGYDLVVLGHSHVPALWQHGRGWYVNAGPWMNDFTFARIDKGVPALYRWDGERALPFTIAQPPVHQS